MPAKDIQGRKIPTNLVMLERWSNLVKQPSEPLPPHMVLDWEQNGAACSTASEPAKITVEEALTPDIVQYFEAHGLNEVLEGAVRELMSTTPRPADPVLALGRLISAEAARRNPQPPSESGAADEAGAAAQPVE